MIHHRHPLQLAKALLSLLLVLVSVAAPVLAETYVCPMAKAAKEAMDQKPSCCSPQNMAASVDPNSPSWSRTCDCPKLSWDQSVTDQTRQNGSESAPVLSAWLLDTDLSVSAPTRLHLRTLPIASHLDAQPPLWLQNQSIRC